MAAARKDPDVRSDLQNDLRQAVSDHDIAQVESLLESAPLDDDFRFELIGGLVASGDYATLVGRLLADAGDGITTTAYVSCLSSAARHGRAETAALVAGKCRAAGVAAEDCDNLAVRNTPVEKIVTVAQALVAGDPEAEARLARMMLTAARDDRYDALSALLSSGASLCGQGGQIVLKLLNDRPPVLDGAEKKEEYLSLFRQVCAACAAQQDTAPLGIALACVACRLPEGGEYPELMDMLADAGADPFAMKRAGQRFLTAFYEEKDDVTRAALWRDWFAAREASYTQGQAHIFNTLFGADFRLQDLRQTDISAGDSGLHLAARARCLPQVMKSCGGLLSVDDLFAENRNGESMLSLAIDRGDAQTLLSPAHWAGRTAGLMAALGQRLGDEDRKWIDMDAIVAQIDHQHLLDVAEDFHAAFRLRAPTAKGLAGHGRRR